MIKEVLKNNIYKILLGIILFIGFVLRLKGLISNCSMWHDECALAWNILNKNYLELFQKLRFLQVAPPMFLICSKFLVSLFHVKENAIACDFVLRLIPFLCGIFSMGIFYRVCEKIFLSKWTNLVALTFFALNPILISYSYEFKPYILDVMFSLIALWIFLKVDFNKDSIKKIFVYGIILSISLWFSFASAFVIFGGILMLSFKREKPIAFLTLVLTVFINVLIYLKCFILNAYASCSVGMIKFWQDEFVKKDFSNISQLNTDNLHYFFMNVPFFVYGLAVLSVFIGSIMFFKENKLRYLFISILTISTLIVASMFHFYPYSRRMVIFLIPVFLIFMVKIFDSKKYITGFLISILLIPHILFAFNFIKMKNFNKGDFSRDMMIQMAKNISPEEKIVVNEASNANFYYYNMFFNLKNEMIYLNPPSKSQKDIELILNNLKKGYYWFYMPYDYSTAQANIKFISKWVQDNSQVNFVAQATQSTLIKTFID